MATVSRRPFAPLRPSRLQNLTSIQNRQDINPPAKQPSSKRRASIFDDGSDAENKDPGSCSKRSKKNSGAAGAKDVKRAALAPISSSSSKAVGLVSSRPLPPPGGNTNTTRFLRPIARPKRPSRLGLTSHDIRLVPAPTSDSRRGPAVSRGMASTAPHRRSQRLNNNPMISRIDPPKTNDGSSSAVPLSLDSALKGSIPSYAARDSGKKASLLAHGVAAPLSPALPSSLKESWFFDIHEDTHDQEMTNLLQHSTCVLDISSDEEHLSLRNTGKDDGGDKENVPPAGDLGLGNPVITAGANMACERRKDREALREIDAREYFAVGCDEHSVFIVAEDDAESRETAAPPRDVITVPAPPPREHQVTPAVAQLAAEKGVATGRRDAVQAAASPAVGRLSEAELAIEQVRQAEELLFEDDDDSSGSGGEAGVAPRSSVNISSASQNFELWESGSSKDEGSSAGDY